MELKRSFFVITTIFCLFHSNNIDADKSSIPTCFISPEVFDINLNSYEDYIVKKCFDKFEDHISKGSYLNKSEFLSKIKKEKDFERFIYIYTFLREYAGAVDGTVINRYYTPYLEDSIFYDYLVWGAQSGNYYARIIDTFESAGAVMDLELLESIKDNKYYLLSSYDMGEDTWLKNQQVFFEKFSVDDFEEYYFKAVYLNDKSVFKYYSGSKNSEIYRYSIKDLKSGLPEGFFHQEFASSIFSSGINTFYENNIVKSNNYFKEIFEVLNIDKDVFVDNLKNEQITPNFYDIRSELCHFTSKIFINDSYLIDGFDFKSELERISNFFPKCFVNPSYAEGAITLAKIWWGLVASWYNETKIAYDLLKPSKFPRYYGNDSDKTNDIMTPLFFNYAALAAVDLNKINEAEEFLYHARDAYSKYDLPNNFQALFSDFIEIKIAFKAGDPYSAYLLLDELREEILSQVFDYGDGFFLDEDINIFINEFIDLTFELKKINENFFVDPLFLFELKNLVFQSENLLNLKKNSESGEYNIVITKYNELRDKKLEIENIILDSNDDQIFSLSKELETLEKDISRTRNELLNLKSNLKLFYGSSRSSYLDIQDKLSNEDVILFYNFSISEFKLVVLDKNEINLYSNSFGRNKVTNLIKKVRSSIELQSGSKISDLNDYDFESSKLLYESILKDININKYKNIYTFTNEILNSIPFQILVSDYDSSLKNWNKYFSANWLNKNYNFAILETLLPDKKQKKYNKRFVGLGDPDLSNNYQFNDLPNTKNELVSLAQASGGTIRDLYLRKDANINNFREMLKSNAERVVIATHAFPAYTSEFTNESGIVLSSNNSKNNFITASEIAQLNINSEFIVLSVCDTGLSDIRYSKNHSSLSKAFLAAGVESVLISNWSIESSSSAKITKEIFNNVWFDKNISKHEALNIASENLRLDLSKEYNVHPAFWGAFSIVYSSL